MEGLTGAAGGATGADISCSETVSECDLDEHFLKALPEKEMDVSGLIGDLVKSAAVLTVEA